jgi:hypothetical protein
MQAVFNATMSPLDGEPILQLKMMDEIINEKIRYIFNRKTRKYDPAKSGSVRNSMTMSEDEFFDATDPSMSSPTGNNHLPPKGNKVSAEEIKAFDVTNRDFSNRLKLINEDKGEEVIHKGPQKRKAEDEGTKSEDEDEDKGEAI